MKVAILGAVHGTSPSERLIFETYKAAVSLKIEHAEILTPNKIYEHRAEFVKNNPKATDIDAVADMVRFDLEEVSNSDLVLVDISLRSTGLGMELARIAEKKHIRVLLFAKSDCLYSDMIVGLFPDCPVISYGSADELAQKLDELL